MINLAYILKMLWENIKEKQNSKAGNGEILQWVRVSIAFVKDKSFIPSTMGSHNLLRLRFQETWHLFVVPMGTSTHFHRPSSSLNTYKQNKNGMLTNDLHTMKSVQS